MAGALECPRLNDSDQERREIRHVNDNKQEHLRNNTGTEAQPDIRPCFFTSTCLQNVNFLRLSHKYKVYRHHSKRKVNSVTYIQARGAVFRWSASVVGAVLLPQACETVSSIRASHRSRRTATLPNPFAVATATDPLQPIITPPLRYPLATAAARASAGGEASWRAPFHSI
ncbi:hypothetical protein QQF64_006389 [Cirrhinus molitorella]|uniref:Uncharacterized protein n=1 Tax=Cirrhinus molitorella TaxID=172907 RepID=A0ABR3MGB2_9TELE